MSLELAIQELTAAVRENTAALGAAKAKPATTKAAAPSASPPPASAAPPAASPTAPAPSGASAPPAAAPSPSSAPTVIPPPVTMKEAGDELTKLVNDPARGGRAAALAFLAKWKVQKLSEIKPEKLAEAYAEIVNTGKQPAAAPAAPGTDLL